jgi:hypothetical protein
LWVAGGDGAHKIATSSDGVSWTGSTSGDLAFAGGECYEVAYNGIAGASGLWVAGGDGAHYIAYSSDGVSWTGSASGDLAFAGGGCHAVAYGTNLWVAGGDGDHKIAYSSNGVSWTGSTSGDALFTGAFGTCQTVAYNAPDGLWVVGNLQTGFGSLNTVATSSDGIIWTASTGGNAIFSTQTTYLEDGHYVACISVATNGLSKNSGGLWVGGGCAISVAEPEPEPVPPPQYQYGTTNSSFNIFSTNFSGMGNLGDYQY